MKSGIKGLLVAVSASAGLFLYAQAAAAQQGSPPLSSEQIAQIVASPDRSAADRTNDLRRKPEQMLAFIGIRPGIVALDLSAAGGYTTELLARAIGPSGTVYGQSRPRDPNRPPTPRPRPKATATRAPRPRSAGDAGRPAASVAGCAGRARQQASRAPACRPRRSSRRRDRSKIPFRPSLRRSVSIS